MINSVISFILENSKLLIAAIITSSVIAFFSYFYHIVSQNIKLKNDLQNALKLQQFQKDISSAFATEAKIAQGQANALQTKKISAKATINIDNINISQKISCEFNHFNDFNYAC